MKTAIQKVPASDDHHPMFEGTDRGKSKGQAISKELEKELRSIRFWTVLIDFAKGRRNAACQRAMIINRRELFKAQSREWLH